MPPKVKITKNDIIEATLKLLRTKGEGAINARNLAESLGSSTQPVFSNFPTMEKLREAAREAAYKHYLSFLEKEVASGKYPEYKSFGMAYIRFAREEKELFKFLFMRNRSGEDLSAAPDFKLAVEMIMEANGISKVSAELLHLEMWACVHGIATMAATSFLSLEEELVSQMLSDVYLGARTRHMEAKDGCN